MNYQQQYDSNIISNKTPTMRIMDLAWLDKFKLSDKFVPFVADASERSLFALLMRSYNVFDLEWATDEIMRQTHSSPKHIDWSLNVKPRFTRGYFVGNITGDEGTGGKGNETPHTEGRARQIPVPSPLKNKNRTFIKLGPAMRAHPSWQRPIRQPHTLTLASPLWF